jgi:hypothetical protein
MRLSGDRSDDRSVSLMGISKFERFFRSTAGLRVDKNDLKRYSDFVNDLPVTSEKLEARR